MILLHEGIAIQLFILELFYKCHYLKSFHLLLFTHLEDKVIPVTRSLRTRNNVPTKERLHEKNSDVEVRRSCRIRSRYSSVNQSVLFDKLITK